MLFLFDKYEKLVLLISTSALLYATHYGSLFIFRGKKYIYRSPNRLSDTRPFSLALFKSYIRTYVFMYIWIYWCSYVAVNAMYFQFRSVQFERSQENGFHLPNGRTSAIEAMYLCMLVYSSSIHLFNNE